MRKNRSRLLLNRHRGRAFRTVLTSTTASASKVENLEVTVAKNGRISKRLRHNNRSNSTRTSRASKSKLKLLVRARRSTQLELTKPGPKRLSDKLPQLVRINARHRTLTLIRVAGMNRNIFYIIGVIVVIVIVLKLLGLF